MFKVERKFSIVIFMIIFILLHSGFGCSGGSSSKSAAPFGGNQYESGEEEHIIGEGYAKIILEGDYSVAGYAYSKIYFNLRTGEVVPKSLRDTNKWDIMIEGGSFFTNSGSTAADEGSSGEGGSYFSGDEGLDALSDITSEDVAPDIFEEDRKAWIFWREGINKQNMNGMNLLTTAHGSGSMEDPYMYAFVDSLGNFDFTPMSDKSDDEAVFWIDGMPPGYYTTERIHIIKCADGESYAKLMWDSLEQDAFFSDGKYRIAFYYNKLTSAEDEDTEPPSVVSTYPEQNAVGIPMENISISAVFSETMDASTINSGTFKVGIGASDIDGTVEYISISRKAVFTPSSPLEYESDYIATITTGAADLSGNHIGSDIVWSFTTLSQPGSESPTVVSTYPENNASDIPVDASIRAVFSEDMDASTINSGTFKVSIGASDIKGTVEYVSGSKEAVFTPSSHLVYETSYTAAITTGAADLSGDHIESDVVWSFVTEEAGDTAHPVVCYTKPDHNLQDAPVNAFIRAVFSETMDASTINNGTFKVSTGAYDIEGTVKYISGSREAVFTPSSLFEYETTYTAAISSDVKNITGITMEDDYVWKFTTGQDIGEGYNEITLEGNVSLLSMTYKKLYFNLRAGELIPENKCNTKEWDLMIEGAYLYTNSGSTASAEHGEGSSGNGGSYFAGLEGFDELSGITSSSVEPDRIEEDYNAYVIERFGKEPQNFNGMKLLTMTNGTGAEDDPYVYTFNNMANTSDDEAVYRITGMPPTYYTTERIYIIRCADGFNYAKIMFGSLTHNYLSGKYWTKIYYKCVSSGGKMDDEQPIALSTYPEDNEVGVPVNIHSISAVFSEKMDGSTINSGTFFVSDGENNAAGTAVYRDGTASFILPSEGLNGNETYTVTITTGVADISGNNLASDKIWNFTTGNQNEEREPPSVVSTNPDHGAIEKPNLSTISAVFDRCMNPSSINTDTFKLTSSANDIEGIVEYSDRKAFFTPINELERGETYTATIIHKVEALSGCKMEEDYKWSFSTTAEIPEWTTLGWPAFSPGEVEETKIFVSKGVPFVAYVDVYNNNAITVMKYNGAEWVPVGEIAFSDDNVKYISLYVDGETPFVSYRDNAHGKSGCLTVQKFNDGEWVTVGEQKRFSDHKVKYTSLFIDDGVPYVAFRSCYYNWLWMPCFRAMAMKFDDGKWNYLGGEYGVSDSDVGHVSLFVYSGAPYIAYRDEGNGSGATMIKYNSVADNWSVLGAKNFSNGGIDYPALFISEGTPYVAYRDEIAEGRATLMKYTDSAWNLVGGAGFSEGVAGHTSLHVYNGAPYVVYRDGNAAGGATVKRYSSNDWKFVGDAGFSRGEVEYASIFVYNGVPYVVFRDMSYNNRATVMKFE